MARNKRFKRTYTIRVRGTTTNNFMESLIDDLFAGMVKAINDQYKQIDVELEIKEGE